MNTKLTTIRPATTAIAAVLAFSTTTLMAQEAPVIVLPDASAPQTSTAPAAPVLSAPVSAPPVQAPVPAASPSTAMISEPMVQAVPEPEAAPESAAEGGAAAPATTQASAGQARSPRAAPVAETAPSTPPAVDTVDNDQPANALTDGALGEGLAVTGENAEIASVAPITDAAPADNASVETTDNGTGALLAGGAVIGLGLLGFAAFRRRKPGTGAPPVVEKPVVVQRDPVPAATTINATTGNFDRAAPAFSEPTPLRRKPIAAAAAVSATGGAVQLPRAMPETFEERDALLRRMVAAKPDRANPFRAPKARVHRARLIMQSLDKDFADRDPMFDTSEYPNNWPLVARRKYATAA